MSRKWYNSRVEMSGIITTAVTVFIVGCSLVMLMLGLILKGVMRISRMIADPGNRDASAANTETTEPVQDYEGIHFINQGNDGISIFAPGQVPADGIIDGLSGIGNDDVTSILR